MPQLTVEGFGTVAVEDGKRLVLAIEQNVGVDILHACGGNARLSGQILCDPDLTVRAISRREGSGRPDPGPTPAPEITPPAEWT